MPAQRARRSLIGAGVGLTALGAIPGGARIGHAKAADTPVRMTTGLRAASQCKAWLANETAVNTRRTLEKAGVTATYPGLGTYEKIYSAIASGEIEAGAAPIRLRFLGERQHDWHAFPMDTLDLPSVFATTRTMIASNRDVVLRAVRGMVEAIHLFKARPDVAAPLLQRFLNLGDRSAAQDLHAHYVPLFSRTSKASLGEGMQGLRDTFARRYPAVERMQASDIVDSSFIDELERSGFVDALYARSGEPARVGRRGCLVRDARCFRAPCAARRHLRAPSAPAPVACRVPVRSAVRASPARPPAAP